MFTPRDKAIVLFYSFYCIVLFVTNLLTYWFTNLCTHSLTHSLTYLLPCLFACLLPFFLPSFLTYLLIYLLTYLLASFLPYLLASLLPYFLTYLLTHSLTYLLGTFVLARKSTIPTMQLAIAVCCFFEEAAQCWEHKDCFRILSNCSFRDDIDCCSSEKQQLVV